MTALSGLRTMDDASVQDWLRKVEKAGVDLLVCAMLGADPDVRNRVYANMSGRAGDALKAEIAKREKIHTPPGVVARDAAALERLFPGKPRRA